MAEAESGTNPLEVDPEGFRARCARRIEMGRVWVLERDGQLLFKADIMADTPEVVYLEGIWVSQTERGKGLGQKVPEAIVPGSAHPHQVGFSIGKRRKSTRSHFLSDVQLQDARCL